MIIKCPLQGMGSNAVITLHSRLWNSTFIEVTEQKGRKTKIIKFFQKDEELRGLFSFSTSGLFQITSRGGDSEGLSKGGQLQEHSAAQRRDPSEPSASRPV